MELISFLRYSKDDERRSGALNALTDALNALTYLFGLIIAVLKGRILSQKVGLSKFNYL